MNFSLTPAHSSARPTPDHAGITLIEVLIAMTIFALVSLTVLSGLSSGDRIRGRGSRLQTATLLAENLTEHIAAEARWGGLVSPGDSIYLDTAAGREFEIVRSVLDTTALNTEGTSQVNREITVTVRGRGEPDTLVHVRLVQGYLN